jgi:hypothetical protein
VATPARVDSLLFSPDGGHAPFGGRVVDGAIVAYPDSIPATFRRSASGKGDVIALLESEMRAQVEQQAAELAEASNAYEP